MSDLATAAALFCAAAVLVHVATTVIACARCSGKRIARRARCPAVTVVRPLRGVDPYDEVSLRSGFELDHPSFEMIFCCADAGDPAVPLVRGLMARYPHVKARLLIGDTPATANPKLNNMLKGWRAATHDWIVFADCNVLMPRDYLERLFSAWRDDTGLVCSPPAGCLAEGLWAEVECAFLNTYQARWQYTADSLGLGFAQGKTMLARRLDFERAGGLEALGREIAEDAAATKVVASLGLRVRLVDGGPFPQPLGQRTARQVWARQVRWARLRRATFPAFFAPEIFSSSLAPMLAGLYAAEPLGFDPLFAAMGVGVLWFGCEALLARAAGWHMTLLSPAAWIVRDLLLPVLWVSAWTGNSFNWRGNEMQVPGVAARK